MAKKKVGYEVNRNEYNKVRKMDHSQMQKWANDIFEKGQQSAKRLTPEEIHERLVKIKGIGENKADAIIKALTEG
ncbi:MAG: hypothetical protein ACI4EE_14160 [Lachnospiraceae bacterium]